MGCEGLMAEPWAVRSEEMVQEFQHPRSNEWEGTIRRDPNLWTADIWADVYRFRKEGRMRAGRTGTGWTVSFGKTINTKDGHAVERLYRPKRAKGARVRRSDLLSGETRKGHEGDWKYHFRCSERGVQG